METRRAKRYRKAHTPTMHTHSTIPNYFQTIPQDAQEVILRQLSTRPNHSRWVAYLEPRDVQLILQIELSDVSRNYLTSLHHHFTFNVLPANCLPQGPQLEKPKDISIFNDIIVEQMKRIQNLSVDIDKFTISSQFEYGYNLRQLVICRNYRRFELDPILKASSEKLENLQILNDLNLEESQVVSITKHCNVLKHLTLHHDTCDVSLIPLWAKLGRTLQSVCFQPPRIESTSRNSQIYRNQLLDGIARNCHQLTKIELYHGGLHSPNAPLLLSLGSQLKHIRFMEKDTCPTPPILQQIADKCVNAKFSLFLTKHQELMLQIVGPRLETLKIRDNFTPAQNFGEICKALTNLRGLTLLLRKSSFEFVRTLLNTSKAKLTKINCNRIVFDNDTNNVLSAVLPNVCSNVRDLEITTTTPVNDVMIDKFLRNNRELRRIWINNKIKNGSKLETKLKLAHATASLLTRLVTARNVMELVVRDGNIKSILKTVADACVPLRSRRIDVIVGDVRYLPNSKKLIRKYIQY